MRKMKVLFFTAGLVLLSIGIANSHSDWAKYQFIPVPDYVNVPEQYILEDGTLDCCGCHWNTKHAGPGQGFCD
jgi:hypothetical protein